MGTYHLGAQPPRWVRRRAQDGQLGAGYVHRISVSPPSPLHLPAYLIKSRALRSRPDKEEDASRMFHHVYTSSELNLTSDMTWWA